MNNRAKYDREHSKTPKEFLKKSRLTTEPIGGGVVYDGKGELVEYDVALEALKMAREVILSSLRDTFIENKNIVDYDSSDPFISIYWKDLVSAIKKIQL